jgi:hypothetical protein
MTAISGLFKDGTIKLDGQYVLEKPVKVIVTFLGEVTEAKQDAETIEKGKRHKPKTDEEFNAFLLYGPVMTKEEELNFKETRKAFKKWRTK